MADTIATIANAVTSATGTAPSAGSGVPTTAALAYGEPKVEILKWVAENGCDLIAMSTHGHRFIGDLLHWVEIP